MSGRPPSPAGRQTRSSGRSFPRPAYIARGAAPLLRLATTRRPRGRRGRTRFPEDVLPRHLWAWARHEDGKATRGGPGPSRSGAPLGTKRSPEGSATTTTATSSGDRKPQSRSYRHSEGGGDGRTDERYAGSRRKRGRARSRPRAPRPDFAEGPSIARLNPCPVRLQVVLLKTVSS